MSRAPLLALAAAVAVALCGCGGAHRPATTSTTTTAPPQRARSTARAPTPGSKAAAPGVPSSREGDNSIQTWGLEASNAQRTAATATVQRYLDARAGRDWAKVCSLLAAKPRAEQERLGAGAPCAQAMASFAAGAQTSVLRQEAEIEVLSFRVSRKYAFLIYRRPGGVWATALVREAGAWKVVSVTPEPLS
jgi:hypothetical protein